MPEPITLEVFSDYVCPWCYLGDNRVKKLRETFDIKVKLVHYPLHPETPAEGRLLMDMFGTGQAEIDAKNTLVSLHVVYEAPMGGVGHRERSDRSPRSPWVSLNEAAIACLR